MARIFVSHSSRDNEISAEIMAWLRANGFDQTFLDIDKHSGIQPGTNWERTLYQQIDGAHAVILVLTPHWLESKWCFAEFTQARALGKAIFPVIVAPGGERFVAPDIQQLDLRADREGGLTQLAHELTQIALDAQGGFAWDQRRPPYPGLLSFQAEDAAIYFGRDDDVRRLIERLNARRIQGPPKLVAMLGSSGSGKSSLLRAGVLPRLERDRRNWIVLPPFRPRLDPVGEFARAAAEALERRDDWQAWRDRFVSPDPGPALKELSDALQSKAGSREAWLLISIDQAEELFTVTPPEEAQGFLRVMKAAAAESSMYLGLITLRSDYLGLLQQAAEDVVRFEEFSLGPMPLNRIRQVIEGPARVAGLKVEEGLIAAAAADAGTEDALPLLAFTLRELYDRYVDDRDGGGGRQLALVHYAALGDPASGLNPLENSVRKRADEVLAEANPSAEDLQALREAFIGGLVWINSEGEYSRRPAKLSLLPEKARPLLERLEAARLAVFGEDAGERTVEVAHESLLRKWPRLRGWLDEERDFLIGRMQLDHALADWQAAGAAEKRAALLRGLLLSRARQWLTDHPRALSEAEKAFIAASVEEAEAERRRGRRLRNLLIAGAAAVVAIVGVAGALVFMERQRSETLRREAEAADLGVRATLLAFASRDLLQRGDVAGATAAAVDAVTLLSTTETRSSLLESVLALSPHLERSAVAEDMRPGLIAFVPDTTEVLAGGSNGRLHLWDPAQGATPAPFATLTQLESAGPQPPAIRALTATRVGGVVVLLDDGRLMRLDASGAPAGEVRLAEDIGRAAAFAPGGGIAVAASQGSRQIGVYTCGSDVDQCEGMPIAEGFASAVAISDDGKAAAAAVEKDGLVRADLSGPIPATMSVPLEGNPRILSLAFDPAGATLAAGAADGRVFLIDAEGGVRAIVQPEGSATALAFAPDGSRLAASCGGPDICIYALGAAEPVLVDRLRGHANTVLDLAWSEDGAALASASVDGSIKYWTSEAIDPTAFVIAAPGRAPLTDVALSPDGKLLAAGGDAGSVTVFDMTAKAPAGVLSSGREAEVRSLRWSPDKPWLAAVDEDGFLTVRNWPEGEVVEERRIDESVVESVRWTPDGKALLVATLGGAVRIWPLGGAAADFDGLHPEPVLALAVLPDGKRVVSTDALGNVWLWDITARTRIETSWTPADAAVDTAVVSNGGKRLLVAGNGGVLFLYDLETPGAPVRIDTGARQIDGAAWSPDDARVAAVDTDGNLKVYSVADGRLWAAAQIYPPGAGDDDEGAHLRRMLWLPGSSSVAIATSAGEVAVVTLDQPAWLARARSVFGLPEPVVKSAPADRAPAE